MTRTFTITTALLAVMLTRMTNADTTLHSGLVGRPLATLEKRSPINNRFRGIEDRPANA